MESSHDTLQSAVRGGPGGSARYRASEDMGDEWAVRVSRGVAKGDRGALSELYEAWFDKAYNAARRATGGRGEALCMDVVQESFIRVIRSMQRVNSEAQLAAWMQRVVTSAAYDILRKEMRLARREREGAKSEGTADPERVDEEQIEWLARELVKLEGEEREVMELRHRFGMTLREVGGKLGMGTGAVDRRVTKVVERMRERGREVFDE